MSTATDDEIQKLKFAILEAESRCHKARKKVTEAEVDLLVLRERLKLAENSQEQQREAQR